MDDKKYKKIINAWSMYDWANSAFVTTVMAAILPIYYANIASPSLTPNQSTTYWAYTTAIGLLLVALVSPILGVLADFRGHKKRYLTYFVVVGITATSLMYFLTSDSGDWLFASILFIVGNIGFAGANVFYDSLLPHIAKKDDIDQVSTRGYALGYLGGGILLAINLAMIMLGPDHLAELMTRISLASVAVWWLLFSIPLWRNVPEPPHKKPEGEIDSNLVKTGFKHLLETFKEIRKYGDLFKFLVAFWLYNDGIGTIIKMATKYGDEIGIGRNDLIGALLMVQFVGIPFSFAFGWLAKKIGTKKSIFLSLSVYTLISIGGYFMNTAIHFWILGFAVALVQGGSQALSRSLYGRMVPKAQSAEFFSFFSVSGKFAGIAGPAVFGFVNQIMGNSRLAIVSLIIFFISGALLLTRVDEEEGIRVAQEADALAIQEA
ncbi:MAG: MFS transporter [Anaerolineales bacterium]|nr:MFS transporter [Anaerolineales bacterium]